MTLQTEEILTQQLMIVSDTRYCFQPDRRLQKQVMVLQSTQQHGRAQIPNTIETTR